MTQTPNDLHIPGYRLLRELGHGGMANVYLAEQESIEREVALKVMLPALAATDPSFSARFIREAKIVARLAHPHIIAVYDVGIAGPYHYFSMEYVTGGDLKARIRQGMMPKLAFTIIRQVAMALAFAHAKGYVHRDVKPENVLFRQDGTALLTDFGIAKSNEPATRMTATGAVIGTPHYMSPEQAQGHELDHRSDLYSLGVMLYELLTGNLPYTGSSAVSIGIKHLKEPIPQLAPPVHVYQALIDRLLAKNPDDRFQSGDDVLTALDAMSSGASMPSTTPTAIAGAATVITNPDVAPTRVTAPAQKRKAPLLIAFATVALLLAGITTFLMLRDAPMPSEVSSTAPPITNSPEQASDEVARLLTAADEAALAGRYLEPQDNNAVSHYRQVLKIDADNKRAARGLQEIARHFISAAEAAIEKKDYDQADVLLTNAERADPNHPLLFSRRLTLSELRQKHISKLGDAGKPVAPKPLPATPKPSPTPVVMTKPELVKPTESVDQARQRDARDQEQRLQGFYTRIEEMLSAPNLTPTRLGLASELLAEALKLAPGDARARTATSQITDGYLRLATAQVEKKEYKEAEGLVRRGLELKPDHRLLLTLEKDIAEKQKPKRQTFGTF